MATPNILAIPGRPGFESLLWWFMGPSVDPHDYEFGIDGVPFAGPYCVVPVNTLTQVNPYQGAQSIFVLATRHSLNSAAGTTHTLVVSSRGHSSNEARSRTLPGDPAKLQFVLASCFYYGNSRLIENRIFPATFSKPNPPPHLKMLCGDQIYIDLTLFGCAPKRNLDEVDAWALYREQWFDPGFLAWMSNGANLCMADDHEFWNNYPSPVRLLKITDGMLPIPTDEITHQMYAAYIAYQGVLNSDPEALLEGRSLNTLSLNTFQFPSNNPPASYLEKFSLFVLDTRTQRLMPDPAVPGSGQFTSPAWLADAINWIANLKGPGLLVTTQSMLDGPGGTEANLSSFGDQFQALWKAIDESPHELVLMTGDIHWSRAQKICRSGTQECRHHELVASALCRIDLSAGFSPMDLTITQIKTGDRTIVSTRVRNTSEPRNYAIIEASPGARGGLAYLTRWWRFDANGTLAPAYTTLGLTADADGDVYPFEVA